MQKVRALVTGSTGFIGGHLVRHLVDAGYDVHLLVRRLPPGGRPGVAGLWQYTGRTEEVLAAVESVRPDVTFHLASLFLASHTAAQITPLVESNVLLGTQLLEAVSTHAPSSAFVNAGTSWQFYHSEQYRPVNLYAATKQALQSILAYYAEARGLRCTTLHLFDSYGPCDARRKLLSVLLESLQTGQSLTMPAGEQVMDLAHVDDICRAFLHAAKSLRDGTLPSASGYAVSGGQRRTLREVIATFERAAGRPLNVEWGVRPYREREVMQLWNGPALPGWAPLITLETGLRDLLKSIHSENRD